MFPFKELDRYSPGGEIINIFLVLTCVTNNGNTTQWWQLICAPLVFRPTDIPFAGM